MAVSTVITVYSLNIIEMVPLGLHLIHKRNTNSLREYKQTITLNAIQKEAGFARALFIGRPPAFGIHRATPAFGIHRATPAFGILWSIRIQIL